MEKIPTESNLEQSPKSIETKEELEIPSRNEGLIIESRLNQSHASRLAEYITGFKIDDPAFLERLKKDQEIIRSKYNLPDRRVRIDEPAEYEKVLRDLAKGLGVDIKSRSECGQFFEEYPYAGAVNLEKEKRIGVDIRQESRKDYLNSLADLEHELIHAEQAVKSPNMPIELKEYEAYLVGANMSFLEENPDVVEDIIFGYLISGSVKHWYKARSKEQRAEISPEWDNPEFFLENIDNISEEGLKKTKQKIEDLKKIQELRESLQTETRI